MLFGESNSYQEKLLIYDHLKDEILDIFTVIALEEYGEAWDIEVSKDSIVESKFLQLTFQV